MTTPRPIANTSGSAFLLLIAMGLMLLIAACGGGSPTPASPQTTSPPSPVRQVTPVSGTPVPAEQTIDLATDEPSTVIFGADSGDYLNDLPALVTGDVNGDGLADLLIGARFGDGPQNSREDSGEAYVIFGSPDLPSTIDLAHGDQDLTIYGAAPNDQLGYDAILADVNGDGLDDLVLGAPFAQRQDNLTTAGAVYVLLGGPDLSGTIDLAEMSADLTLLGADGSGFFGDSLATTDANGDGITDIVIGTAFARHPVGPQKANLQVGAAYVIFGSSDLGGTRDMAKEQYDVAIFGAEEFDEVGDKVAGGDVNGDGIGDIIITAEAADGPDNARPVTAEVYVVYGSPDLSGVLEIEQGDQDVTIFGAEDNDTLGFNLAIGDINGDNAADIFMTARLADGPDNLAGEAGEIHIVLGGDSLPRIIDLAAEETDAYIYGPDRADFLGASIGTVDIDGDGHLELFTASGFGDGPANARTEGGEAYVLDPGGLQGAVNVLDAPLKLVIYGPQPGDRFGSAMTTGDLDGDGAPEIIVLAFEGERGDGTRSDAGQLYIIKP